MKTSLQRRRLVTGAAKLGLAGIAAPGLLLRPGWSQTGPIKIGLIEPRSGPYKYIGDGRIAAAEFVADRVNASGGLLGRKLEFVAVESEMKPDVASRRANDLILGEKVAALSVFGGGLAKVVAQVCNSNNKIFFSSSTLPTEMTSSEFLPTTFSLAFNEAMLAHSVAAYIAKASSSKVYILCQDYASGHSAAVAFRKRFDQIKRPEQNIVGEEFHPPFKINDFAPYITKIMASGADTLMTANFGPDLRLLIQQGYQLGWKVKVVGFYLNDPTFTSVVGDAAIGHVTTGVNMVTLKTPLNTQTIAAWRAKYPNAPLDHRVPDLQVGQALVGNQWLVDVIRKAGSLDTAALIKAWEGDSREVLWGPAQMRACDHQMQSDCGVATIMKAADIPADIRFFPDFPYIGPATVIPVEAVSVPLKETSNKRCTA